MGIFLKPKHNMSISQDLVWQLTKRNNAHLVKFNENMWSKHPLNMSGFHNSSAAASTISVKATRATVERKSGAKQNQKRFQVAVTHGAVHGIKKMVANSSRGAVASNLTSATVHSAKRTIDGLVFPTHGARRNALRRLQRVNASTKASKPFGVNNVNGAAAVASSNYKTLLPQFRQ